MTEDEFCEESAWRLMLSRDLATFMTRDAWSKTYEINGRPNPMGITHVYLMSPQITDAVASSRRIWRTISA